MIDYERHFAVSLAVHGEIIQTPVGDMRGIVRIRREDEVLNSKSSIELDMDHSRLSLSEEDAALLQKGQSITARGKSYDLGKPIPRNSHVQFLLVDTQINNPSQGNWK